MAVTHGAATRTVIADLIDTQHGTAGVLVFREGTTDLVVFALQNPAFGAASGPTITLAGTPITQAAVAAGDADNFETRTSGAEVILAGSITATGGGGDITVDNVSIANLQEVTLNSLTYTAPA